MSLDPLKPLEEVGVADERWRYFNRSIEEHHGLVAGIELAEQVPMHVRQQFENARNAWLYAYFAFWLSSVALLVLYVTCESALRARAAAEGLSARQAKRFSELLNQALARRWLTDEGFAVAAEREANWEEHRGAQQAIGQIDPGPWAGPFDDQEYSRVVVGAVRSLRNSLAHGETLLKHNLSHDVRAAADFINQLFPADART